MYNSNLCMHGNNVLVCYEQVLIVRRRAHPVGRLFRSGRMSAILIVAAAATAVPCDMALTLS